MGTLETVDFARSHEMKSQLRRALAGNSVEGKDRSARISGAHLEGKHLALGLANDISFRNNNDIRKPEHWPDLGRRVDARQRVDYADAEGPTYVRGATVAKAGTFCDQYVKSASPRPLETIVDVADEKVVRADAASQADGNGQSRTTIRLIVLGREAIEFDDAHPAGPAAQGAYGLDHN